MKNRWILPDEDDVACLIHLSVMFNVVAHRIQNQSGCSTGRLKQHSLGLDFKQRNKSVNLDQDSVQQCTDGETNLTLGLSSAGSWPWASSAGFQHQQASGLLVLRASSFWGVQSFCQFQNYHEDHHPHPCQSHMNPPTWWVNQSARASWCTWCVQHQGSAVVTKRLDLHMKKTHSPTESLILQRKGMMVMIAFPGAGGVTLSVVEMQTAQKARKAISVQ
mmetsp:Transcript_4504/g.7993  ORF Transcript_4504/g.7993 Transcript_4504/m.7993 type:complete len:219 (+) Transcript_4504:2467-3123(+)